MGYLETRGMQLPEEPRLPNEELVVHAQRLLGEIGTKLTDPTSGWLFVDVDFPQGNWNCYISYLDGRQASVLKRSSGRFVLAQVYFVSSDASSDTNPRISYFSSTPQGKIEAHINTETAVIKTEVAFRSLVVPVCAVKFGVRLLPTR